MNSGNFLNLNHTSLLKKIEILRNFWTIENLKLDGWPEVLPSSLSSGPPQYWFLHVKEENVFQ